VIGFFLVFLLIVLTVLGSGHYYLWRRLVRDTTTSARARKIGLWVVAGLLVLTIGTFVGEDVLPPEVAAPLAWVGYMWLALMFYLIVVLAVLELPALVAKLVLRRAARRDKAMATVGARQGNDTVGGPERGDTVNGPADTVDDPAETPPPAVRPDGYQSRRLFLGRVVAATAGVAAVGLVGSGIGSALSDPQLRRVQIPLAKLPRGADGFRIALVSDIHIGPLNGIGRTRRIVEMINGLDADIVAVVGDLVDGSVAELGPAAAPLGSLRSRHGSFFVTGNHEYYSGHEEWLEEVERLGMRPLRNERLALPDGIDVAGVNDVQGAQFDDAPDMAAALAGRDPARPVVMLSHQPVQAHDAARHGVDLQLSGHTHGGQLFPFHLIVRASGQPVVSGLGSVDGMPVYVTNGAGFWGPPVRVGAPPDVTLVELRTP
jgi:predicted MPP superfamily phosphohydrolase